MNDNTITRTVHEDSAKLSKELNSLVASLADTRAEVTASAQAVDEATERLEVLPEHADWANARTAMKNAKTDEEELKREVGELAVRLYELTGEKWPHEAVQVVTSSELSYNPDKALAFCLDFLPLALTLDKTVFEKIAKALPNRVPCCWIETVHKARVASDLSQYEEEVSDDN